MKPVLPFAIFMLIALYGLSVHAQTDTDDMDDDGLSDDRFKPVATDSDTQSADSGNGDDDGLSDDRFKSTDSDIPQKNVIEELPDTECDLFTADYVEILNPPARWQSRDTELYPMTVRWDRDGRLQDLYSNCCWPADEEKPRCEIRVVPKTWQMPISEWRGDAAVSYERLQPLDLEENQENYRNRFSVNLRSQLGFNPGRGTALTGVDVDVIASLLSGESDTLTADGYRLFARALNAYAAWRWMPMASVKRGSGTAYYGRHRFGVSFRGGVIRQSIEYANTFFDMPIYQFYGRAGAYDTEQNFRHYGPMTAGLLARTGLEGRSRIGGLVESNNTFSLPIEAAHVLMMDFNTRLEFLGATLLAPNDSMALEHPATMTFPPEATWEKAITRNSDTAMAIAPKLNVGVLTKTDTLRLHLAYSGEYTVVPSEINFGSSDIKSRYNLSTFQLDLGMHILQLKLAYIRLKTDYERTHPKLGTAEQTQTNDMFRGYLAFHLFEMLAKFNQRLVHYKHALSYYMEYLYNTRQTELTSTAPSSQQTIPVWNNPSFTHTFKGGLISVFPLYPSLDRLASHPHGVQLDLLVDVSVATVADSPYMTGLLGLRLHPY